MPEAWQRGLDEVAGSGARRIAVLGPTDVGKSSFIRALAARSEFALVDLDPGQKMVGPPGTIGTGWLDPLTGNAELARFVFVGTTSASAISAIVRGAERFRSGTPFVVNTSGFVSGPGARLQAACVAALDCDLVVAIGLDPPPLPAGPPRAVLTLPRSPLARRKSPSSRRQLRQLAFERHLGGELVGLPRAEVRIEPAPARDFLDRRRPLCALADARGEDMVVGVLEGADAEEIRVRAARPPRRTAIVRLGRIWALPSPTGWSLGERLEPAWED